MYAQHTPDVHPTLSQRMPNAHMHFPINSRVTHEGDCDILGKRLTAYMINSLSQIDDDDGDDDDERKRVTLL